MSDSMIFDHHKRIIEILSRMDPAVLKKAECYFGGGTAISLLLNEYRESVDIDFLCSSDNGYRFLRETLWDKGIEGLFKPDQMPTLTKEPRIDRDKVKTFLQVDDRPVKLEIVREGRISLSAQPDLFFNVPVLTRTDLFACKLLANCDRVGDAIDNGKDIFDIAMMISFWGEIPKAAWDKTRQTYGLVIDKAFVKARDQLEIPGIFEQLTAKYHISEENKANIMSALELSLDLDDEISNHLSP